LVSKHIATAATLLNRNIPQFSSSLAVEHVVTSRAGKVCRVGALAPI
jgi:hypothetical protein